MKLLKIEKIEGNEELARSILTNDYKELLSEGARLKKEYIPKLQSLGITEVYIKDKNSDPRPYMLLKEEVGKSYKEKIKNIISRHTYQHSQDMIEIGNTANDIISDIMEDNKIIEQIFDIKRKKC